MRDPITPRLRPALLAVGLSLLAPLGFGADDKTKGLPKAPADHVLIESDTAGAYFVARPLQQRYDALLKRSAERTAAIDGGTVDEVKGRREVDQIQSEIAEATRQIDRAKRYFPAATVSTRSVVRGLPLAEGDHLFVEAGDVEIRPGQGPEVSCSLEKTVLGEPGQDIAADLDGIELVTRRTTGRAEFGYYRAAADRPAIRHEYDQFPFKPFLDREFTLVRINGLDHQEGNRQIRLDRRNEAGEGSVGSVWRRRARLVLTVPKCRGVGVRGALQGFRAISLEAPLMVHGQGDRDYRARFEVADLGGPLTASDIPIHRIDGVRGDVSILATAYDEDVQTVHDSGGVAMKPVPPRESAYDGIKGDLRVRACRFDLSVQGVEGRVDVENDFGRTAWRLDRPMAARDHRVVSQSGSVELRLSPDALGPLGLSLFTECGAVQLPKGDGGFQSQMFSSNVGDVTRRSWHGFVTGKAGGRDLESGMGLFARIAAALQGKPRSPGVDIISRAGTITMSPIPAAPGR